MNDSEALNKEYMDFVKRKTRNPLVRVASVFVVAISLCAFWMGAITDNENILLFAVFTIWFYLFIDNCKRSRFTVLAFAVTFFSFLLGTIFLQIFDPTIQLRVTAHRTLVHMYICLYIALLFVKIGTSVSLKNKIFKSRNHKHTPQASEELDAKNKAIRKTAKAFYCVTSIATLLISAEKAVYVLSTGAYVSYYVNFTSLLPGFVNRISDMSFFSFFIYLATLPDPRKSKYPFAIYLLTGILGLLYGQRNQIIMSVLLLLIYCVLYENHYNAPYTIIKRKHYVMALLCVPFVLWFLYFYMFFRDGLTYQGTGVFDSIKDLFQSLGGSVNVIGEGFEQQDMFPKGKVYSFGGVIDFFTNNVVIKSLFNTEVYQNNTIDMALKGNSFGQTLTYLCWGQQYLAGRGMGSCYIAEAFKDFGYFGVAMFSGIYGAILSHANKLQNGQYIKNTVILISLYYVIYSPRDAAGHFISAYFNFSFIITVSLIAVISQIAYKQRTVSKQSNFQIKGVYK